jgi:hypothetical protein
MRNHDDTDEEKKILTQIPSAENHYSYARDPFSIDAAESGNDRSSIGASDYVNLSLRDAKPSMTTTTTMIVCLQQQQPLSLLTQRN